MHFVYATPCINNVCNLNNLNGIHLYYSDDNDLDNNTCNSNARFGIYIEKNCGYNTLMGNTCDSNKIDDIISPSDSESFFIEDRWICFILVVYIAMMIFLTVYMIYEKVIIKKRKGVSNTREPLDEPLVKL